MPIRLPQAIIAGTLLLSGFASAEETFNFRTKYIHEYKPDSTRIVCKKVDHAPKLDGTLNDPVWQQAGKTDSAFMLIPQKEPSGRQTVVYTCYDDQNLYVAFDCEEPELEQQQIDDHDIFNGDHVGIRIEVGDYRGRGQQFVLAGNRAGYRPADVWNQFGLGYKCAAGPHRWFSQFAIPFKGFGRSPLRGEAWGVKFIRYGKTPDTGALRLRTSWPYLSTPTENTVLHNAQLFFDTDNILANGELSLRDGKLSDFDVAAGKLEIAGQNWTAPEEVTLVQKLQLQANGKFTLEWSNAPGWQGTASISAGGKSLAEKPIGDTFRRLDFTVPAASPAVEVALKLKGTGAHPAFRLSFLLDDVPLDWICLTNNDWLPERNLKNRLAQAAEGTYTYLKSPLYAFGYSFYADQGCPGLKSTQLNGAGIPLRDPLPKAIPRPDIGEDEFEGFPVAFKWNDASIPDLNGLINGSFEKGGDSGWISFSKGSLTGDESWAGWPTDRWASGMPHDIVLDFKDKYFIRRVDILQAEAGFRNCDLLVRNSGDASELFVPVFRANGPGTAKPFPWPTLPAYISVPGVDSVARELRVALGTIRADGGLESAGCRMFGVAEIWVWAEPKGQHKDTDVNVFKPFVPNEKPPLQCAQLEKLPEPVIWPRPKEMKRNDGRFVVKADTAIVYNDSGFLPVYAQQIRDEIKRRFVVELPLIKEGDASPKSNAIWIGMQSASTQFDKFCAGISVTAPGEPQGYTLAVTPERVIIAGTDIEGTFYGIQSLLQWADHDEENAFFRSVAIKDWPLLKLRTVIPTPDHRNSILPGNHPAWNYYTHMDGLARYRFNGLVDWMPTAISGSEEKTHELRDYAAKRLIELRPALFMPTVPGECIEINPDDVPDIGHLNPVDGYWENCNLCPSNPTTYRTIDSFLDGAMKFCGDARFVEVGYMGALMGKWNVCRLCQKRGLSDGKLYGDYLNRISALCRKHGKTAIFTNAVLFSSVPGSINAKDLAEGADMLNRALVLRVDRPMEKARLKEAGFWSVSNPWDTPAPVRGAVFHANGKGFFEEAAANGAAEGAIITADKTDFTYHSAGEFSDVLPRTAESFWNGPEPAPEAKDRAAYEETLSNASVRFNENLYLNTEYPSWRTGIESKFFKVDIRTLCTRSHIDEGTALGVGRSGPREGMIGNGPGLDLRRVPTGAQTFAGVPFDVIDPNQNNWKSMVVVTQTTKQLLLPGSLEQIEIPIGKKAASLCVLRMPIRKDYVAGSGKNWVMLPAYVFVYEDGTRHLCDSQLGRWTDYALSYDDMCFRDSAGNLLGGSLLNYLMPTTRVAYRANTLAGFGASLFLNEFVNPYPEKTVKSLVIQAPNPEQKSSYIGTHEAVFAITGVEPTAWDIKYWQSRPPLPLLQPEPAIPAQAVALLSSEGRERFDGAYAGKDGKPLANIGRVENEANRPYYITFDKPHNLAGMELRLSMPGIWENPMWLRYHHLDVKILFSEDGKIWQEGEVRKGCTGMDGTHRFLLPERNVAALKIVLDGSAYKDEEASGTGIIALKMYERESK